MREKEINASERERKRKKKERVRGRERKKERRNEAVIYAEKEIVSFNLIE